MSAESLQERGRFDVVHSANVFEHLRAPAATLDELRELLSPQGHVVISVPNVRSLTVLLVRTRSPVIAPPHHLQYYTPRSMATLAAALKGCPSAWPSALALPA